MTTPTDPLYGAQWHFPLIGDIETIWDEYSGNGVSVGVYDDGLEYDHPDLAANYDASLHFESGGTTYDPMPVSSGDAHGTACAGLIAAVDNNGVGGTGVAHGATLTGVNFLADIQFQNFALVLECLDWARNFDIMSNSWGRTPNYEPSQSLAIPSSARARFDIEFGDVVEFGRGGLGTVIVQAAGNDTLNGNGDGLNASRYTATIAATDFSGNITSYSNFGTSILVAAPAASVTTDLTGTDGYNTSAGAAGNYTTTFGGTSAATPVTAGIVALMLEANPLLGWRDVQNILAISAAQTGSAYGGAGSGNEVGNWGANGAANWNGGGMTFHQSYGFGMVDAFAAVRMAEIWNVLNGASQTTANEQQTTVAYAGAPLAIPDFSGGVPGVLDIVFTVTEDIRIEDIYVTVDMQHSWSSDLILTLIGTNGEEFVLMNREGGSTLMDFGFDWVFGVTGALGMMSAGTWTLRITDNAAADVGTVTGATLDIFGAVASSDDVHHFTQDLFDLIAVEGARQTISDTNGGIDWLNFAAMGPVDITVNFNAATVAFSSTAVVLALVGAFENAVTGDGNDTIIGNGLNNELHGMRGDDSLNGVSGDDTLHGGDGNDTLNGGAGDDSMVGGTGDDTYFVDSAGDSIGESAGAGIDTVRASVSFSLVAHSANLERLVLGGSGDIDGTGNALGNLINGNDGNNTLDGLTGNDTMNGSAGNDTMNGGGGFDTLRGDEGDDVIMGGASGDVLMGGLDDDHLFGESGNDIVNGDGGLDTLEGGLGADTLDGGNGNDLLLGGDQNDVLRGGGHNDTLIGGSGRDLLFGDGGADDFVFGQQSDSAFGSAPDRILDFVAGVDDIDLSGLAGAPLTLVIGGPFTGGGSGSVITREIGGNTRILIDLDGDRGVDMHVTVVGTLGLTAGDFIL